ncbi:tetratricopeptide repeat protein [Pseudoteredinibacter isoporae]|uniref:tetratricopeptide repeat protein n=1 Tax=Pseudoteredinibacter isoporae TaxID=570281 RepID=UPI003101CAD7
MVFLILSVLIQFAFVVHIVKTGRSTTWIWIVLVLPVAGMLAYLVLEVLPDLGNTRQGRKASRKVKEALNPNKSINEASARYQQSDTVENAMNLANACLEKGLHDEARQLFEKCLNGPLSDDPNIMFGLATAEFGLGNAERSKQILDELIEKNPEFKHQDAHLLYARSLDKLDKIADAQHEYETLYNYYSGPDAAYYFAKFLSANHSYERAQEIFAEIVNSAQTQSRHYRDLHQKIINKAKAELT